MKLRVILMSKYLQSMKKKWIGLILLCYGWMIDKNKILNSSGPKRISKYLADNNLDINLVVLDTTARTAVDAAKSIGVQVGAIVKSLVFNLKEDLTGDDHMILALIAGDRKCDILALEKLTGYR